MIDRIFKTEIKTDKEILIDIIKNFTKKDFMELEKKNKILKTKIDLKKLSNENEKIKFAEKNINFIYENKTLRDEVIFLWSRKTNKETIQEVLEEIKEVFCKNEVIRDDILEKVNLEELIIEFWRMDDIEANKNGDILYNLILKEDNYEEEAKDMSEEVKKEKGILELSMSEIITKLELVERRIEDKDKVIKRQEEKIEKLEEQLNINKNLKKDMSAITKRLDQMIDITSKQMEPIDKKIKELNKSNEVLKSEIVDVSREVKKIAVNKIVKEITDKQSQENKEIVKNVSKALDGIDKKIEESVIKILNNSLKNIEESIANIQVVTSIEEPAKEDLKEESTDVTLDEINKLFT